MGHVLGMEKNNNLHLSNKITGGAIAAMALAPTFTLLFAVVGFFCYKRKEKSMKSQAASSIIKYVDNNTPYQQTNKPPANE
jgi:cbb3-type cytochrome oxidase subunit 3